STWLSFTIGTTRRLSLESTPAPPARTAITHQNQRLRFTRRSVSVSDHEPHARAPEGELFRPEAEATRLPLTDARKVPGLPDHPDPLRQKASDPAPDVHCR